MTSYLRPDEQAAEAKLKRTKNIQNVLNTGGKALVTGALTSQVLPFLSEYVPLNLAMKGINKVAPKIGKFLSDGQKMGLDLKEGLNFIKNDLSKAQSQEQPKKSITDQNPIKQYSDTLHAFLLDLIKKGKSPIEAGAIAQLDTKFKPVIKKLEKDFKSPWSAILSTVFGNQKQPQDQTLQISQNQPAQQNQQQQGSGQQRLMDILQKIQQSRGAQ